MLFIFSIPEVIRHLWQLKTIVFLHWSLICAVLLTHLLSRARKIGNKALKWLYVWKFSFKFQKREWLFAKLHSRLSSFKFVACTLKDCNRIVPIRHQWRKTTVLSRHRCLIKSGIEKMNNILIKVRALTTRCL